MKRLFYLVLIAFLSLIFSGDLKAQIILSQANVGYLPGQEFIVAQSGAGFNFFLLPQTGANQIWNFNSASSSVYDTIKTLSRSQAPFSALLPAANLVVYSNNSRFNYNAKHLFLETNSSKITHLTEVSSLSNNLVTYLETADVMRFPFSINSSFIDTSASLYTGANNTSCTYKQICTVEAVGYGQLITPVATYNQALQVRTTIESLSDNCRPQLYKGFNKDIIYKWYVPGIHVPVYQIAEHNVSLGYIYSGYYLYTAKLGFLEDQNKQLNFLAFPNPTTTEVTIQYQTSKPVKITLHDLVGKQIAELHSGKNSAELQSLKIDVSKYPKGIYLLKLETDGKAITRKLVLQ